MNKAKYLEGGCLVVHCSELEFQQHGELRWSRIAGPAEGSKKLSQFYLQLNAGEPSIIYFADSEVVLYVTGGKLDINIAGRDFVADEGCSVHVHVGEAFSLQNLSDTPASLTATVCPAVDNFQLGAEINTNFNTGFPERVIDAGQSEKRATGDRFYRLLAGAKTGSGDVTQFIGMIPQSKAAEHFHLYEETIYILSGEGYMWAGDSSTAIRAGSMIFLPRRQPHCLECTNEAGMLLVGSFYPAGSPEVNYATSD